MTSGISSSGDTAASGVGNSAVISSVASNDGSRPGSARTGVVEESVGAALVDDDESGGSDDVTPVDDVDVVAVVGTPAVAVVDEVAVGSDRRSSPPQPGVTSMTTTLIVAIERFTIRPYATSDEGHQSRTSSPRGSSSEQRPGSAQVPWT
jgi:hypothetical protein